MLTDNSTGVDRLIRGGKMEDWGEKRGKAGTGA